MCFIFLFSSLKAWVGFVVWCCSAHTFQINESWNRTCIQQNRYQILWRFNNSFELHSPTSGIIICWYWTCSLSRACSRFLCQSISDGDTTFFFLAKTVSFFSCKVLFPIAPLLVFFSTCNIHWKSITWRQKKFKKVKRNRLRHFNLLGHQIIVFIFSLHASQISIIYVTSRLRNFLLFCIVFPYTGEREKMGIITASETMFPVVVLFLFFHKYIMLR